MKKEETKRINEKISAYRVRLIDQNNQNLGEVNKSFALQKAREAGLDLVEVSSGYIPTCKILDWGKYQYQENKHKQKHVDNSPKEIKIFYNIGEADLNRKKSQISEFLSEGHKVVITLETKKKGKSFGRTISPDMAKQMLLGIVQSFNSNVTISDLKSSGNNYSYQVHPIVIKK